MCVRRPGPDVCVPPGRLECTGPIALEAVAAASSVPVLNKTSLSVPIVFCQGLRHD